MKNKDKNKNTKEIFIKLIKYISIYRTRLILALIIGLVAISLNVIAPRLMARVIDEFYRAVVDSLGSTQINLNLQYVINTILTMMLLYLTGGVLMYMQGLIMADISVNLVYKLRKEMVQKISKLPISYFDKASKGDILSRLTNDVYMMTSMLSHAVTQTITAIIMVTGTIIMMYTINWICATVAFFVVPATYFSIQFVVKHTQKFFKGQQKSLGDVNGYIEEVFSQNSIVKYFNAEEQSEKNFEKINDELYKYSWKSSFFSCLSLPIVFCLTDVNYLLVVATASVLTLYGAITVGDIQSFVSYVKNLKNPLSQISNITFVVQRIVASSERVFEFLDAEEEHQDEKINNKMPKTIKGDITFKNVCFGYNTKENIIKNISFSVKAGQKAAFVGATGSGKTTIVKLLMRFYEINSGNIYIDDVDISSVAKSDLRSVFSMVLQDSWLYSGSVADNIRYSKLNATAEEVEKVAKMAYVDNFIKTLPQGYKTPIEDGAVNISQGEKQLLTIARAMLANPQILILDEATSSVDIKTEGLIQKAMDNLMKERTSFIIAHRLSTIRNADIIFVIDDGKIVESGSHDDLMKINGLYSGMYNSQFQGIL